MKHFRLAIGFLTVFPFAPSGTQRMGPARAYFPLVGLALGGLLAGLDFGARAIFPPPIVGALLVVALLVLTRALHMEGFLDSCDGLLGGNSPARRLEILKDTHVGAFAVAGGTALLLTKWSLLVGVPDGARVGLLVLFPCLSRVGMVSTMAAFPYARQEGTGTAFQKGNSPWQIIFGVITAAVAGSLLFGVGGLLLVVVAGALSLGIGWCIARMLGGMTGDTYGAVNEMAEVIVLLIGIVLYSFVSDLCQPALW